ncbi:DUF3137 domain-containing protein [Campylobacter ureolyticus]|uniref:DUF3137 domain-containing protein n=1 Tax=Campylobacter ureolyticus TaxID=827 RepID=UPI0022B30F36|nr:DUF3137 domain-containing protein [Campylobacter ureolyticus]MCZ6172219.1 DUF3137 domain-containing protein [Campylobacter ureolyticus]
MLKEIKSSHEFYLKRIKIATNLLLLSGALWGISYFFIDKNIWYILFILFCFVGCIFLMIENFYKSKFISIYKDKFIKFALNEIGLNYERKGGFKKDDFDKINIYKSSKMTNEDEISGIYKGLNFKISDLKSKSKNLYRFYTSNSIIGDIINTYSLVANYFNFSGIVLSCEINLDLKEPVFVLDNSFNAKSKISRIKFDDIAFDDAFKVYSKNELKTREFLSSNLRNSLLKTRNKLNFSAKVSYVFSSENLFIFLKDKQEIFSDLEFEHAYEISNLEISKKGFKKYQDEVLELLSLFNEFINL